MRRMTARPENTHQARLLRLLRDNGSNSRAQLGDLVDLSRSKLAVEVDRLLETGLVVADGLAPSRGGRRSHNIRLAPTLLSGSLVVLAVYGLYFRHPAGKLADHDAYALRMFTDFYLTLPALVASLLGLIVVSRQAFWRAPALFVTYATFCVFFFYKIRIVPEHFWMTRRFLAVVLPGALLFAAAAALGSRVGPRLTRPLRWAVR